MISQEQLDQLDPQSKARAMAIMEELQRRQSQSQQLEKTARMGQVQPQQEGLLPRFGRGIQAGLAAAPSIILEGKMPSGGSDVTNMLNKALAERYVSQQYPSASDTKAQMDIEAAKKATKYQEDLRAEAEAVGRGISPQDIISQSQIEPQQVGGATVDIQKPPSVEKERVFKYDKEGNVTVTEEETEASKSRREQWKKESEVRTSKKAELNVKREALQSELESFFAVDDLIDRAKGGFLGTKGAAAKTWWKSQSKPIDPLTGQPDVRGSAAATHEAASKRLRVQLVRAAGDVGNINIVEQEAAEKLIPRWDDSVQSAELKRAYLKQISKAINDGSENEIKRVLQEAGVGFVEIKRGEGSSYGIGTGGGSYEKYLQDIGQAVGK